MRPVARRSTGPQASAMDGDLTDLGIGVLAAVLALGGVLWVGATAAAVVTGHEVPNGGVASALAAVAHPRSPAAAWAEPSALPGPAAYWAATTIVLLAAMWLLVLGLRLRRQLGGSGRTDRIRSLPGMATANEADSAAGRRALVRRASVVRPSLATVSSRRCQPQPEQVGYRLGRLRGRELW